MEQNLACASVLLEGCLSGCHFFTRDLYALQISERDADFGIPRMLYKFDCDFEESPICRERSKNRREKIAQREKGGQERLCEI